MARGLPYKIEENEVDASLLKEFDGDIPAKLYQIWEQNSQRRMSLHRDWLICIKFTMGKQWLNWSPKSAYVYDIQNAMDSKRADVVRATINRILPAYDLKMGYLTEALHIPEVLPAAGRADAYELAQLETQFLQALWWNRSLDEMDEDVKSFITTFGLGWMKVSFDYDTDLVDFDALTSFEVLPCPFGIKNIMAASQMIETQAVAIEKLRTKYPSMADWDEKELQEENMTLTASTDVLGTSSHIDRSIKGLTPVRESYAPPSDKHPRGFKIIATRKRLLELKPLKNADLWNPYFQFRYRTMPGALYPPGLVLPMVSPQLWYNKVNSDIIREIHMTSRSHLMLPESLNINAADFNDNNGPIEYYDDDQHPENRPWHLTKPPMQPDLWQQRSALRQDTDDISHVHPLSRGERVPGVTSGRQTGLLQAPDEVHLSPLLKRISRTWGRVFDRALVIQQREQRGELELPGIDPTTTNAFVLQDFKSQEVTARRVRVRTVPTSPTDQQRNEQKNDRMLQYGVFNDMPPAEVRKMFAAGVDGTLFPPYAEDRVYAKEENTRILSGDVNSVKVEMWDNHEIHLEEHRRICLHSRFREADPNLKAAVVTHMRAHETEMMAARQGYAANQGAGGNAGGRPSPGPTTTPQVAQEAMQG